MTPMFDSAAQMMRSDEGPWAASQSKSSSDGDTDSGSNGFVGMPRGLFCGEFRLDSYLPVTVDWSVRFAALFEADDQVSFKVNGEMHVALCRGNEMELVESRRSGASVGSLTRVLAERPCLAEQVEGEYVQTEVLVRYEHSLDAGEEVEVTLTPKLGWGGAYFGLGLGVKLRGSRDACATLYREEGAEGVPHAGPAST